MVGLILLRPDLPIPPNIDQARRAPIVLRFLP
jgi:hypothetical protein